MQESNAGICPEKIFGLYINRLLCYTILAYVQHLLRNYHKERISLGKI